MKLSDEEFIKLLKTQEDPQPRSSKSEWWVTGFILLVAILAFLYENTGR